MNFVIWRTTNFLLVLGQILFQRHK